MSKRKTNNLKVEYGGIAKPLGDNYFLMHGATHEQGGIGIGKDLEVENGEIVKVNPKSVKVLSNAPIMNGISPAQFALNAPELGILKERFNKGFRYQEAYKDKHKLNDDGTKKAKFGKEKKVDKKLIEDVIRTSGGITGQFLSWKPPFINFGALGHAIRSGLVALGNEKAVAEPNANYTGVAMEGKGIATDNGLGFVSTQDLIDELGEKPIDFVDTYLTGETPFAKQGVIKKDDAEEKRLFRTKLKRTGMQDIQVFQTHKDTLDANTLASLEKQLASGKYTYSSQNTTYKDSPFKIGDTGLIYDGNNSTIIRTVLPDGRVFYKANDIFDTNKREWNYKVGPLAKWGLNFIDNNTTPFMMTTPWYQGKADSDTWRRMRDMFGIDFDKNGVLINKGDSNGKIWDVEEALQWIDEHPYEVDYEAVNDPNYKKLGGKIKNKFNNDYTKKKFGGRKKKLIGGDENTKINNNTFPQLYSEFYTPPELTISDKLMPPIPQKPLSYKGWDYENKKFTTIPYYDADIEDITDKINQGDVTLYPIGYYNIDDEFMPDFYRDKNTNRIYRIYRKLEHDGQYNTDNFEKLNYDQIRKMLPRRDYIGGDKKSVGIQLINRIPNLKDTILTLASQYGISPDLFAQRITNEGWLQNIAKDYNGSSVANQKTFAWQDYMDNEISGYYDLGLDTFGDLHKGGKLNLRRNIEYRDDYNYNEDQTGKLYNSAIFKNAYDALEAKAAMFEYFYKLAKERNIPEADINAYVNAMYNMGPYHKDLNNMDYVRRTYGVTPYFKLGGKMKKKSNKRYIPSTGERKKANLGIQRRVDAQLITNPYKPITKLEAPKITIDPKYRPPLTNYPEITVFDKNPNLIGNIIQGGTNIVGALATGLVNRSMLNDLEYRPQPTLLNAVKLKTDFNINPQIKEIKDTVNKYNKYINKNTASSQVSSNRMKQMYLTGLDQTLSLKNQRENIIGQLINSDSLNQQEVINTNITNYDEWLAGKTDFKNNIRDKQSENSVTGIQTGAQTVNDFIANNQEWRKFITNMNVIGAGYPNVTPKLLASKGIPYPLYAQMGLYNGLI